MSKTFIVLGMHRSATSLMAKALHEQGVNMGDHLLGAAHGNPLGHFEDKEFLHLNDRILSDAGGSWNNPPSEAAILQQKRNYSLEIRDLVARKNASGLWGWKDPRTILTIRLYTPYLDHPHYIAIIRNPVDVAMSLHLRDGSGLRTGKVLAIEYNKRLSRFMSEVGR